MEGSEYLLTCAEVAVALAGFSALIIALTNRGDSSIDPVSRAVVSGGTWWVSRGYLCRRHTCSILLCVGGHMLSNKAMLTLRWVVKTAARFRRPDPQHYLYDRRKS